jgi:serine/threonine protein kinase/formylglycine-generating enzyme required for sulfatase activity
MTDPDPDDAPTRFGGDKPSKPPPAGSEDRTLPALPATDRQKGAKAGKPDEATRFGGKAPPPAGGEDRTLPAMDRQKGARAGKPPAPAPAPAPPPPPPAAMADPLIGKQVGGCRIDKLLGRGAMGAVYKARQTKLDRDVAVKVIRPEMMTDQRMLKRFEVEARTVGKFNSANVVMVHDVGFEHGVHYLVMEFVQGQNLRDHVRLLAGGRLPVGEALPLLRQSIKGLEEAQRLSVIHRDIKPDNLMITDRGVLKIADFGIAKPLQEDFSMTLTSELVGTPLYMSPEQCQGEAELDFRSDMYSLGATFYYLLTGEPPIRASSVYELIQTKTKLAHLCLWKALPGLDENNPLSRVIERMTSLDRDDRYDSYEALLNDLVLVEQGQTITTPAPGAGRRGKAAPSRSKWLAIGAIVLLLAGGGIWYATHQPKGSVILGSPEEKLSFLRSQLTKAPNKDLHAEIARLEVPEALADNKQTLLRECDSGIALADALQAIPKPKELALPFEDLRVHFAAVDKAVKDHPVTGAEVTSWSESAVRAARNEALLAPKARETLALAWATWTQQRGKAASMQARAALGPALSTIEAARANLFVLLPTGEVGLKPTQEEIDEARRDLTKSNDVVVPVDVTKELQEVRDSLEKAGPTDDLKTKLEKLTPEGAQRAERDQLINTVSDALRAKSEATIYKNQNRPDKPQLPFEDLAKYWTGLDESLRRARAPDGKLPPWADALRTEMRGEAELRDKTVSAMAVAWRECQHASAADAGQKLTALRAAKVSAKELFGEQIVGPLDLAVPDKDLDAAASNLARIGMKTQWLADANKLSKQIAGFGSLSDWNTSAAGVADALTALRNGAAALGDDADVAREQKRLGDTTDRWGVAQKRMTDVDKKLGGGDLKAATPLAQAGAAGAEGRAEFQLAVDVVTACERAFGGLEKSLAVEAAQTEFATAREKLRNAPCLAATEKRLASWLDALGKLADASRGMVAIPSGKTKGGNRVDAFFLAATECSRSEFAAFVNDVRAEVQKIAGSDKEKFEAVSWRFGGAGMTSDRLRDLLQRELHNDKLPIDSVSWHTAAACAAWTHRELPTADEWTLAAFGDGGAYEYPWGNGWSNEGSKRNPSNNTAADVDVGGLSWRSSGNLQIHHLAGNVAEWLAADANAREAQLAGGRYNDTDANAKARAGGAFETNPKDDGRRGMGFRTVLRVRSFPGLDWPK